MTTHPLLALQNTEDEFMELLRDLRKKIQKLKLAGKDEMESILREYRQ